MVEFLSPAWIARLEEGRTTDGGVVLRQVVSGVPAVGQVTYDLVISGDQVRARRAAGDADVTCSSDYVTASSVAAGTVPVHVALAAGRIKVAGDVVALANAVAAVAGAEAMPAGLRAATEFPAAEPPPGVPPTASEG